MKKFDYVFEFLHIEMAQISDIFSQRNPFDKSTS